MFNFNLSPIYSSIDNIDLSSELNFNGKNYSPNLSSELSLIENSSALTDNRNVDNNIDNAINIVFGNNHNIDDILLRTNNVYIEINNSEMNSNFNHYNLLGRKKKGSGSAGEHNEYSEDNMIRKFKIYNIDTFITKINSELKKTPVFIENNGKKYKANKLKKLTMILQKILQLMKLEIF